MQFRSIYSNGMEQVPFELYSVVWRSIVPFLREMERWNDPHNNGRSVFELY